jgi:hypothetical protein
VTEHFGTENRVLDVAIKQFERTQNGLQAQCRLHSSSDLPIILF